MPGFLTALESVGVLVYEDSPQSGRQVRWIAVVPQWAAKRLFGK